MKVFACTFLLFAIPLNFLWSQCTPPMAETCEEASVICSLDELNGYSCNNPSSIPSPCSPLCSGGGVGHNTSWWAFVCNGGEVSITITIGSCLNNQGLQFGIWEDCTCGQEVVCHAIPCAAPNSSTTLKAKLTACKTYYLWVDGCSGDVCDFTISTPPGGPSTIKNLDPINNILNSRTMDVCIGACRVPFFVNKQPNGCEPNYAWTCHGMPVGGNEREIYLDFPVEGDFEICVTAFIGNPSSGSLCAQSNTQCILVRVRKALDKTGAPRTLCWQQVNPLGYKWHDQTISTTGVYRQKIKESNCCEFDSIVEFIVLEKPITPDVYFISVDRQPYVDVFGRSYYPCLDKVKIDLPSMTNPFQCDSSINITVINMEPRLQWKAQCFDHQVKLIAEIVFDNLCNLGENSEFEYRWFLKNDPKSQTINKGPLFMVDTINEEYCVEVKYKVSLGNVFKVWTEIYCDTIEEQNVKNSLQVITLSGCDSIEHRRNVYKESTRVIDQFNNATGCNNILVTEIKIAKSNSSKIYFEACDSAIINGVIYYNSGNYNQTLKNTEYCDSILNINIEISESTEKRISILACDSVIVDKQMFYESGETSQLLKNSNGCDSIVKLEWKVNKSNESFISLSACDSLIINGNMYWRSGQYIQHLINVNGCDSTLHLDLSVKSVSQSKIEAGRDTSICEGQFIELAGKFSEEANLLWTSSMGYFENANKIYTRYFPKTPGINRIFLEASDDCNYWIDSMDLLVYPVQRLSISGDSIFKICEDNFLTANGASNYLWTPRNLIECLNTECSRIRLKNLHENTILSVRSSGSCSIPANIRLIADQMNNDIYIPNVFTPNGDNVNDEFYPVLHTDQFHSYNLKIFDRWGTLVFESVDRDTGWNGKYRNGHMHPGVYTYLILYDSCENGRVIKSGDVTLIR